MASEQAKPGKNNVLGNVGHTVTVSLDAIDRRMGFTSSEKTGLLGGCGCRETIDCIVAGAVIE